MKIKLDENLDIRLVDVLASQGVNVTTVHGERICGASDEALFNVCRREHRTLVTLDLYFANPLRFPPAETSGVVIIRSQRTTLAALRDLLVDALPTLKAARLAGGV
ncbi:MAG: DUF5615 family PIN-like protein [Deltaproteobacteria bacterium]|nr:DUF5615 family PIN-like protein [Deltaproteobacteria bacterium]